MARTTRVTLPLSPVTKPVLRLVKTAAIAGFSSGLLLTLLQRIEVVSLIRNAETFERGAHEAPAFWATLSANVVLASGFALLLAAAISLDRTSSWRRGLLWGLAGYFVFFVAPAFGLPPELPGSESAPLENRQLWWVSTVACCAAGLAVAVFGRNLALRGAGAALIVLPFMIGAPEHSIHASALPAELERSFARATYFVNAVFWLALGAITGFLLNAKRRVPGTAA